MTVNSQKKIHLYFYFHSKTINRWNISDNTAWPESNALARRTYRFQCLKHSSMTNLNKWVLWLDTDSRAAALRCLMKEVETFYLCQQWLSRSILQGELQKVWRLQAGLLTLALPPFFCEVLSRVNTMWYNEDLPAAPLISALGKSAKNSHGPHTVTCVYRSRASSV